MNAGPGSGEILLVTSSYPRWPGDATTPFVHHLAQDLRGLGWNVQVLAPHAPGALRDEVLDGVPVHRFRYLWPESLQTVCYDGGALVKLRTNRWNYTRIPFLVIAQWFAILARVVKRKVALLHSHWLLPQGFTAACIARLFGVAHIATVHGGDVFALRGRFSRACKRFVIRQANAVTVNSSATQAATEQLVPRLKNLVRIPMGASVPPEAVSVETFELRDKYRCGSGPLLIFVGRLVMEKGVSDFLDAVAQLRPGLPDVTAMIVGDGQDRSQFQEQAQRLGISDCVTFTGWIAAEDVHCYLRAADMFVGPSRLAVDGWIEAQGLTLIEAMLSGLPVIATATGGITDAIRHGITGLTVDAAAPGQIADAVRLLVVDPKLAGRLAREGQVLARNNFTRQISSLRFSDLYSRLLEHS